MKRTARDRSPDVRDAESPRAPLEGSRTWLLAGTSAVLLWAAMPPLNLWPLAWVAPVGWLLLVRQPALSGRRPYRAIWVVGCLHWLVLLQGVRLAHWATYFGWIALACYLAIYLPLFVALTRTAVHRLRIPLVLAGPVIWTGLELARGHLLTGFSLALLAHSQARWVQLIQVADLGGAYAVTFLVMLGAAAAASAVPLCGRRTWWPVVPAAMAVVAAVVYGHFRLRAAGDEASHARSLKVALIQGSVDTAFGESPEYWVAGFERYLDRTLDACRQHPDLDLVIWPESVFTGDLPEIAVDGTASAPAELNMDASEFTRRLNVVGQLFQEKVRRTALAANSADGSGRSQVHLLVGVESEVYRGDERASYNAALLIEPAGTIADRYNKMHPVMFGEYVPLGSAMPWLYQLVPMTHGLTPGAGPKAFFLRGLGLAPSVCFESSVPHLIRNQVNELQRTGQPVDLLVNLTNDGWFHGSSILDLHLVCSVFRAVENRRPLLIAANTGFSAWIDGSGVIRAQGARHAEDTLVIQTGPDRRESLYQRTGDGPAWLCLTFCVLCGLPSLSPRRWASSARLWLPGWLGGRR